MRRALSVPILLLLASPAGAQVLAYELRGEIQGDFVGNTLARAGDVDGDGVEDPIAGMTNANFGVFAETARARVWSGRDGSILYTFTDPPASHFGSAVAGAGDVDGDGRSDVIVAASGGHYAKVYSGATGALLLTLPAPGSVPSVSALGDVDLDGYDDLLIGAPPSPLCQGLGAVTVRSGFDGSVLYTVVGNSSNAAIGAAVARIADLNADGIDDFATSSFCGQRVYVHSGGNGALLRTIVETGVPLGPAIAGVGDVNGDGLHDLAVGAPGQNQVPNWGPLGSVYIFSGADGSRLRRIDGEPDGESLGISVAGAGDVDGDGVGDVLAGQGELQSDYARLYSGATGALLHTFHDPDVVAHVGYSVAGLGDLNGDGRGDVVVGDPYWGYPQYGRGVARVYLMGATAPANYCVAKTNSLGCVPSTSASGAPSVSIGGNFVVRAHDVLNNRAGKLIWSRNQADVPFGGGTLCLAPQIVRTPVASAGGSPFPANDCSGTYAFAFTHDYLALHALTPGTAVHCQFWSRDGGFAPPGNMGLTDGLTFTVLP